MCFISSLYTSDMPWVDIQLSNPNVGKGLFQECVETTQSRKTSLTFNVKSKTERLFVFQVNHEIRHVRRSCLFHEDPSNNVTHFISPANGGWRCYGGPQSATSVRRLSVPTASSHWHCQVTIIIAVTGNRSKVEIFHHKQSPAQCKLSPDGLCQHSPM